MKPLEMHREARLELLDAVDWYDQQRRGLGLEFNDAEQCSSRSKPRLSGDGGW